MDVQGLEVIIMAISAAALILIAVNVDFLCRDLRAAFRVPPEQRTSVPYVTSSFPAVPYIIPPVTAGDVKFHFPPSMFPDRPLREEDIPK